MELSSLANAWVESYLEALLGERPAYEQNASKVRELADDADKQLCAKYHVQQILQLNEEGIRQAWSKASHASLNPTERDARLEYLSWRVWGMKRKKATVLFERQTEDPSELQPLGDTLDIPTEFPSAIDTPAEASTDVESLRQAAQVTFATLANVRTKIAAAVPDRVINDDASPLDGLSPEKSFTGQDSYNENYEEAHRQHKLYVVMISLHGKVRGEKMELGCDADTGGQVKYVVELAKALALHPAVHRVDLLTRLIKASEVDATYGVEEEPLMEPKGQCGGAYIVRLACGPSDVYLRKEALWPHIREFADRGINHVRAMQAKLAAAGEACELAAIHGHYADAGEAAATMSHTLGCTMLLTGHSLGRNKLEHLLKSGTITRKEIEATYNIARRIEGEERALDAALMVFTSTQQEINDQWGLYDGYDIHMERAARFRKARHLPQMTVIPPGLDFSNLKVDIGGNGSDPYAELVASTSKGQSQSVSRNMSRTNSINSRDRDARSPLSDGPAAQGLSPTVSGSHSPTSLEAVIAAVRAEEPPIWKEIFRFLRNPYKPVILAMSRPDNKKNIATLVRAYGSKPALRHLANLVLIMGNRDIIDSMARGSRQVLEQVLKLIDDYDLHGSVAYPKHHNQKDISDIYLLPAATKGVFVNIALQEPFGLTLIEAAAHGVPIIATKNGGPVDIISTLSSGVLVEPTDADAVGQALLTILTNQDTWEEYSRNARERINAYSWPSHCVRYIKAVEREAAARNRRQRGFLSHSHSYDGLQRLFSVDAVGDILQEENVNLERLMAIGSGEQQPPQLQPAAMPDKQLNSSAGDLMSRSFTTPMELHSNSANGFSPVGSFSSPNLLLDDTVVRSKPVVPVVHAMRLGVAPRSSYRVLVMEGRTATEALAGAARVHPADKECGMGVISFLGHKQTLQMLKACKVDIRSLDFVAASGGSELWYAREDGAWEYDEAYEKHLEGLWERTTLRRALSRIIPQLPVPQAATPSGAVAKAPAAGMNAADMQRMHSLARRSVDLLAALHPLQHDGSTTKTKRNSMSSMGVQLAKISGPFHLRLDLVPGSPWDPTRLATLIKRRLRRGGIRVQLTTQAAEHAEGAAAGHPADATNCIHLTPQRGTRALALRYLSARFDIPLEHFQLQMAAVPLPAVEAQQPVLFASSDAVDLLGGLPSVSILPLLDVGGAKDFVASTWSEVDVALFRERVQVAHAAS